MKWSDYMRLKLRNVPEDFINQYKITAKTTRDGYVHIYKYSKACMDYYKLEYWHKSY